MVELAQFDITQPRTLDQEAALSVSVLELFCCGGAFTVGDARRMANFIQRIREHCIATEADLDARDRELAVIGPLIDECLPAVRLVSELASMTDTEADFLDGGEIRKIARGKLGDDAFTFPRLYGEEDRQRAARNLDRFGLSTERAEKTVDAIAADLGLRRAGQ